MSSSKTAQNSITLTMEDGPSQDDPNTPSVAMGIINRQRQEQACRAATARHASGRRRFFDPTITSASNMITY